MKRSLLRYLVCPECGSSLDLDVTEESHGEVRTGVLQCSGHGARYPVTGFVPRFVDADRYADSFSRQRLYVRRHFEFYRRDTSGDRLFLPTTGFTAEEVRTGITLEAGCGYGRFVDVVQRLGGEIIGIDLSTHSIELAQDFVGLRERVHLLQCDLFKLPFRRHGLDRAYSIGVLHHTPDTRAAFEAIVPCVRPGGQVAIWVYHPSRKVSADRWRKLTTRLPHTWLYGFCVMNQVLFSWIRALPGGARFNALIPGAMPGPGRAFWLRVLSDFDNLSPTFAHVHTADEVRQWFAAAGFEEIRDLDRLTAVTGRRPAAAIPIRAADGQTVGARTGVQP
jgi:SAM-dependent methyltransferase